MKDAFRPYSRQEADRRAREWQQNVDSKSMVGKRHHIVPHFILSRFANEKDQLLVRDRLHGRVSTRHAGDIAVKDFYTFVNTSGEVDGSLETLNGVVEAAAARALGHHIDNQAFSKSRKFTDEERTTLDVFVAFQITRGLRFRRIGELLVDYHAKLFAPADVPLGDLAAFTVRAHQNEYVELAFETSKEIADHLAGRVPSLLFLDRPLLVIGDEPVALIYPEGISLDGIGGLMRAEEVVMPISPTSLLAYGPIRTPLPGVPCRAAGIEAERIAAQINELVIGASIDWVAAHPEHRTLRNMAWPEPSRPVQAVGDASAAAELLNRAPLRRPARFSFE